MENNSLFKGTLILTVAGIFTRILGFFFRVYMTNVMGAQCIGLYQLVLPVYTLGWSLSCAGFTTAISKLVAQENIKKQYGNSKLILRQCLVLSSLIGLIINLVLYFGADYIANFCFKDPRLILSLKVLAFSFPFMAAGSCIRGYFLGVKNSGVSAISQVLEQCVHMGIIYFFIGKINQHINYTCALAVAGILFGELFSFVYVYIAYKIYYAKKFGHKKNIPSLSFVNSLSTIMSMTIPLSANKITASALLTLENILIPQRLVKNGFSFNNAIEIYGKVTGMAMPLIYFPSVFLISLSISIVPEVSQAYVIKGHRHINNTVSKTILLTSIIGLGAAIFFFMFSNELGFFIYHQNISHTLKLLGIMCPFLYLQMILSGILNGLGCQMFIFKNNLLASFINLCFIYFIIPYRGIDAFIAGWFISLIIFCLLSLNMISKCTSIQLSFDELILKPALAISVSALLTKAISKTIFAYLPNITGLILCAVFLCISYLIFIISVGCVSLTELLTVTRLRRVN